ncbi:MAG: RNA polymerase sigma factor [Salibacteraceae bacterium]
MPDRKQQKFLALYEPVHDDFARFCSARAHGRMAPEDLLHETLLIAYSKMNHLRSEKAFLAFLIGISVRVMANHRKKYHREVPLDEGHVLHLLAHEKSDERADLYFLYNCLAQLPNAQQEAIILYEINGFSVKEVAAIQKASVSAVKKRLERGRKALEGMLTETSPHHPQNVSK